MSRKRVATLNDLARVGAVECRVRMTPGIAAMSEEDKSAIREAVERFDSFGEDNDPQGERGSGSFNHHGATVVWKIDYYDRELERGSEDPGDPAVTQRVLTLMLASEY